jgi:hypothetical protein
MEKMTVEEVEHCKLVISLLSEGAMRLVLSGMLGAVQGRKKMTEKMFWRAIEDARLYDEGVKLRKEG